jgi:hypothetical protein
VVGFRRVEGSDIIQEDEQKKWHVGEGDVVAKSVTRGRKHQGTNPGELDGEMEGQRKWVIRTGFCISPPT